MIAFPQSLPIEVANPTARVPDEAVELIAGLLLAVVERQDQEATDTAET